MRELMFGSRFRYIGRSRSLAEYRADLDGGRTINTARQLAQLPWFAKNVMLKTLLKARLGAVLKRCTGNEPEWPY
jgi:hypothetical protein